MSLPMWGAWIEIIFLCHTAYYGSVAPHAGSVDLNIVVGGFVAGWHVAPHAGSVD